MLMYLCASTAFETVGMFLYLAGIAGTDTQIEPLLGGWH